MTINSETVYYCEKDYALIEEIFCGGYLCVSSAVNECSKRLQQLYKDKDFSGLAKYREEILQSGKLAPAVIKTIQQSRGARYLYFGSVHDSTIADISFSEYPATMALNIDMSHCAPVTLNTKVFNAKKPYVLLSFINSLTDKEAVNKISSREANVFILGYEFKITDKIHVDFIVDIFPKLNKDNKPINRNIKEERKFIFSVACNDIVLL